MFVLIVLNACVSNQKTVTKKTEAQHATPNTLLFEKNQDGVLRLFQMNDSLFELYFALQKGKLKNFNDTLSYDLLFYPDKKNLNVIADTKLRLKSVDKLIYGHIAFKAEPLKGKYILKIYHPTSAHGIYIQDVLDSDNDLRSFFIITDNTDYFYPFGYVNENETFKIKVKEGQQVKIELSDSDGSFPPPVFFEGNTSREEKSKKEIFILKKDTLMKLSGKKSLRILNEQEKIIGGLYIASAVYPGLNDGLEMTEATRYIMNREEYERVKNSTDVKREIELFWKEIGGSKERARELIKQYYNRVTEANEMFTDYSGPGFKTDRGMVYIVFGKPDHIYYYDGGEIWHYGNNPEKSVVNFRFRNRSGLYELERSADYKDYWYQAVDYWRQGKIHVFGR
jgi:GWxTD domain-containing protein